MKISAIASCFSEEGSLEDFLEKFKRTGIKYIEVSPQITRFCGRLDRDEARKLRVRIAGYGLAPIAYCIGRWDGKNRDQIESGFEFASSLGVNIIVGCSNKETLVEIDELCNRYKIFFAIENHWRDQEFESPEDILEACSISSSYIGANIDTGHFASAGYDPVEAAELLKERIYHVHLKDVIAKDTHQACILGTGIARIGDFLSKMRELNYNRALSIELRSVCSVEEIAECRKFCERILQESKVST